MELSPGDKLRLKKNHPCGSDRCEVLRAGMDFRLRCLGCGREMMVTRQKAEKSLKKLIPAQKPE